MATLYDIVISLSIGGIFLAMLIGFNGTLSEEAVAQTVKMMAQTNLTAATDIIDYEFRKMGYLVTTPDSSIITADSMKIKFKGDVDRNGTLDTVTYSLDSAPSGNANKNTHMLYRTVNSTKRQSMNVGITRFRLWYYDANNLPLTSPVSRPSQIKSLKIAINIESTVPYKVSTEKYLKANPGVYWERTFKPKNLK